MQLGGLLSFTAMSLETLILSEIVNQAMQREPKQ
jgi:hypothetical protein